ncbi:MAG: cyclic nucleotide-binding domain-containing protein [Alphaproteobacteria bacterium]|nr:cyclic nucleotide-binding domain-containing protein [Alphaproteobacteria bacterium]
MFRITSERPAELPSEVVDGPLFQGVPRAQRIAFLSELSYFSADPSTVLFSEGEPGDTLWIILNGSVTLTRRTDAGELLELDRARQGDLFGELALISPAPRATTATTLQETDLLVLNRSRNKKLLAERNPAAEALLRYITLRVCRRLRQTDARIALVHDALRGASAAQLDARVATLNQLGTYS